MTSIRITLLVSFVSALGLPLAAQWLNQPTPGIPRMADGKPNLSAPAPRAPDGKPDLSGLWGINPGAYLANIASDLKPGDVQPWAQALFLQHAENLGRDDPADLQCVPQGPRANLFGPMMEKFLQTPGEIAILIEDLSFRQVFLDGRQLPKDPNPSFMGYSVGHWDGDVLVIESTGYNDRTWLDLAGHPHSEALRITERIRRRDFGHMDIEETIDDAKAFTRTFTIAFRADLVPDTDTLEFVCAENERDRRHMVGKAADETKKVVPVKIEREILAQYVGSYDFRYPENPTVPIVSHITMAGDQLFLDTEGKGKVPLMPLSETAFAGVGEIEFVKDNRGVVTHFISHYAEGDLKSIRLPDRK